MSISPSQARSSAPGDRGSSCCIPRVRAFAFRLTLTMPRPVPRTRPVDVSAFLRIGPGDHLHAADADVVEREPHAVAGASLHHPDTGIADADDANRNQLGAARNRAPIVRLFPVERGVGPER